MDTWHTGIHKLTALSYTPLTTHLRNRSIVLALAQLGNKFHRQIHTEGLRQHVEL